MDTSVVVVMVPLPAQGNLNQLLNLSRLLLARWVPVHYFGSTTHNRQAKLRVHGWNPSTISNIHFNHFDLSHLANPSPDPEASIKFPAHLQPLFNSTTQMREPLSEVLKSLSTKYWRVVVVHDQIMAFATQDAASSIANGEAYAFQTVSAFAVILYYWEGLGKPTDGEIVFPLELPYVSLDDCFTDTMAKFMEETYYNFVKFIAGDIYNTCRPIEGRFIDLLAQEKLLGKKKQRAIGPLNPVSIESDGNSQQRHRSLDWLDKQPTDSVIYVSFGSCTSLPYEEITKLAVGLELSRQRFIWVLREADKGDIFGEEKINRNIMLPQGYEERVKGVGMITRDWAPQLEILAHPSTGGFLSHCGWNSCMESFSMGVPIAAWPMHSNQPRNTVLVTKVLKPGIVARDWARRMEVLSSSEIETVVKKLMATDEGDEMRKRPKELGVVVREAASEGGMSCNELDSFITHISR